MLGRVPGTKAEIMVRAVRDHLADSLTTLPGLLASGKDESMHFYFANLGNMQKHLFPALMQAYDSWVASGELAAIERLAPSSEAHWQALAGRMLDLYRSDPEDLAGRLVVLVEDSRFE